MKISERIRRAGRNIAVPTATAVPTGCPTTSPPTPVAFSPPVDPLLVQIYAAPANEPYKVDAIDVGLLICQKRFQPMHFIFLTLQMLRRVSRERRG